MCGKDAVGQDPRHHGHVRRRGQILGEDWPYLGPGDLECAKAGCPAAQVGGRRLGCTRPILACPQILVSGHHLGHVLGHTVLVLGFVLK